MDLNEELKATIDQLGRRFEEFKAANDTQIKRGVADALAEAKLDKLGQAIDDLTGKKEDLERKMREEAACREDLERKVNELRLGSNRPMDDIEHKAVADFNLTVKSVARDRGLTLPADITVETFRQYKQAFSAMMRKGRDGLGGDEVKTLQVGVDADGGFLVPADTTGRIVTRVWELSPIRQLASVQPISSDRLEGITDLGEASDGWVGEAQARPDTNTPNIGKYEIVAHEQYAQPKATQKLLDDASIDIEAWLSAKVADRFARREAAAFVTGLGVNSPRGFCSYPTAATADATRAWGTLEHVNTGVNGDFAASSPGDILFDLISAFKDAHLANANWLTRRTVIAKIRKWKEATTNAYMWQPGLQAGQPSQLLGFPVRNIEDLPALGTASLSLALGNLSEAYQIVDRLGVRTLRDPFTDKPYVKFYSIRRVGGAVVNFEALKFVRFGT